jgi:hypothetical protein
MVRLIRKLTLPGLLVLAAFLPMQPGHASHTTCCQTCTSQFNTCWSSCSTTTCWQSCDRAFANCAVKCPVRCPVP